MVNIAQIREFHISKKLAAAFAMAALTGLAAQIRIPLPFTPVPLTGQVFAVLLSGILLGGRFGAVSQLIYIAAGVAGLPVFAGLTFGPAVLLGPTGGYILGFVPAAYVAGKGTGSFFSEKRCLSPFLLMTLSIFIIYLFGAAQFAFVMKTGFTDTLRMAVYPFIALDLAKAIAVGVSQFL